MNLSNFGINAYKNIANSDSSDKQIKTSSPKADEAAKHKTMNEIFDKRFFPHLNDKNFQGNESARIAAKALTSGGLIKVPEQPREKDGKESIYRRVAKFLMLIGVDEAAKILPHLTEE